MELDQEKVIKDVYNCLKGVIDPELHDNIVDLGMVENVFFERENVVVEVALTTIGCPLRHQIKQDIHTKVSPLLKEGACEVRFSVLSAEKKKQVIEKARAIAKERGRIKMDINSQAKVIAISSGKGGVGKSSVSVNLAIALTNLGHNVGVLDADIWGFSLPRLLGISSTLEAKSGQIIPIEINPLSGDVKTQNSAGILKVVSMGFLAKEDEAIMWRGLILNRAVQHFLEDVKWGDIDYLLIDMPPGTGDIQMGVSKMLSGAQMILVTTPSLFAAKVAYRVHDMAQKGGLRTIGVVENMSKFVCDHGSEYFIFGSGGGDELAKMTGSTLLAKLAIWPELANDSQIGLLNESPTKPYLEEYRSLAKKVCQETEFGDLNSSCSARMLKDFGIT